MTPKPIVLLIGQDRLLSDVVKQALTSAKCEILSAIKADDAPDVLASRRPDLVVVNGDDEIASNTDQLRYNFPSAKFIVLSDSDQQNNEAQPAGFYFADKRGGLDALLDAVHDVVGIQAPGRIKKTKVLVVDDEEGIRSMLRVFLGSRGYSVTTAENGIRALEALDRDPSIKVVLSDVMMPLMGGMETLKRIMGRPKNPTVIMMTALGDREVANQALNCGAFDYVLKPISFDAIAPIISAGISHYEYQNKSIWNLFKRNQLR